MKKITKSFFDLFFTKKFSFSVLLICFFLSFAACGSGGSGDEGDSGKPPIITIDLGGGVEMTMHWVPDGTFQMDGSDSGGTARPVTLTKGFYMGKFEVTQEQYFAVMGANPSGFTGSPAGLEEQGKRPVEQVNWYHAIAFCNRLSILQGLKPVYSISGKSNTDADAWKHTAVPTGNDGTWNGAEMIGWPDNVPNGYRLPTEAEWEYACRADTVKAYNVPLPDGSDTIIDGAGWYDGNSGSKTHQVGLKSPNAWGLYDMHGNVHEWCWDWYVSYSSGPQTDPKGAASGSTHVGRGGNWLSGAGLLRSAFRDGGFPNYRLSNLGFRIVRL